jgi:hypothetical protein
MAIAGNELLVTSYNGLFILNTTTFQSKFFPFDKAAPTEAVSLTVLKDRVLLYNQHAWYLYHKNTLNLSKATRPFSLPKKTSFIFSLLLLMIPSTLWLTLRVFCTR